MMIRQTTTKRFAVPLVTRSTLEVVIPKSAVASLTMRAGSKLAQISEMSGASVTLAEDRPGVREKVVRISGTPEQADKAQSLLQGFILSSESLWVVPFTYFQHCEIYLFPRFHCPVQDDIPSC